MARHTRLSPRVLRALDEGRFAELPGGLYARSYVRAFAAAVSADARAVEEELIPILPGVEEPTAAVQAIAGAAVPEKGVGPLFRAPSDRKRTTPFYAAAFLDGLLLFLVNGALVALVAAACRTSPGDLLTGRGLAVAAICAVATFTYFILFAGVDGRTPGRALCGLPRLDAPAPLRARHIVERAARIGFEEASLVLTWAGYPARRSG